MLYWSSLFLPSDNQVPSQITACLAIISAWMNTHHLKLKLSKTKLLFLQAKKHPCQDLVISIDNSNISPTQKAKNLGVTLDNELSTATSILTTVISCRFLLQNIHINNSHIVQIPPAKHLPDCGIGPNLLSSQLLQWLLANLPVCAIKPLQLMQNAAARLIFNLPKYSHVTSMASYPCSNQVQNTVPSFKAVKVPVPSHSFNKLFVI